MVPKLPPAPKDKLRTWCKVFGHELTREFNLHIGSPYQHSFYKYTNTYYKLCLRCSSYWIMDPRAEARRRIMKFYGVSEVFKGSSVKPKDTGTLRSRI